MKAIVKPDRRPGIQVRDVPEPEAGQAPVIRIQAAAICGTDVHMYETMEAYGFVQTPVIMGHEACGVVEHPGSSGLARGQQVIVDSVLTCGQCRCCRTGRENLCERRKTVGQNMDGVFARYAVLPERVCIPVSNISPEVGACIEPLGVALRAVEQAGVCPGDRVAVVGPGPIGLMALLLCRLNGAAVDVYGTRRDEVRLALAGELGAEHAYILPEDKDAGQKDYTHVLEWSGAGAGLAAACEFAAPGGVVVAGAIYSKPVQLNMTRLVRREISLKTARSRTYQTWRRAIALVERGEIDLTRIITHKFSVEEAQTAFQITSEKKSIKTILYF